MTLGVHPACHLFCRRVLPPDVLPAAIYAYIGPIRAGVAVLFSGFLRPDFRQVHEVIVNRQGGQPMVFPLQIRQADSFLGFFPEAPGGVGHLIGFFNPIPYKTRIHIFQIVGVVGGCAGGGWSWFRFRLGRNFRLGGCFRRLSDGGCRRFFRLACRGCRCFLRGNLWRYSKLLQLLFQIGDLLILFLLFFLVFCHLFPESFVHRLLDDSIQILTFCRGYIRRGRGLNRTST